MVTKSKHSIHKCFYTIFPPISPSAWAEGLHFHFWVKRPFKVLMLNPSTWTDTSQLHCLPLCTRLPSSRLDWHMRWLGRRALRLQVTFTLRTCRHMEVTCRVRWSSVGPVIKIHLKLGGVVSIRATECKSSVCVGWFDLSISDCFWQRIFLICPNRNLKLSVPVYQSEIIDFLLRVMAPFTCQTVMQH